MANTEKYHELALVPENGPIDRELDEGQEVGADVGLSGGGGSEVGVADGGFEAEAHGGCEADLAEGGVWGAKMLLEKLQG